MLLSWCMLFSVILFFLLVLSELVTLLQMLGGGISNRVWDTIIEHALTCVLDDDEWYTYTYYGAQQRVGLLLNSIFKVVAATFGGQNYQPLEKLTFSQKVCVSYPGN